MCLPKLPGEPPRLNARFRKELQRCFVDFPPRPPRSDIEMRVSQKNTLTFRAALMPPLRPRDDGTAVSRSGAPVIEQARTSQPLIAYVGCQLSGHHTQVVAE